MIKKKRRYFRAIDESNLNLETAPWSVKAQEVGDPINTIRELQIFKKKTQTNKPPKTNKTEKNLYIYF